jgi:hypothetical protein
MWSSGLSLAFFHSIAYEARGADGEPVNEALRKRGFMKEMNRSQSVTFPDMQRRGQSIEGVPVLRDLEGPICVHCGSPHYFLVFRVSEDGRNGMLEGRCSSCHTYRELTVSEIEGGCRA